MKLILIIVLTSLTPLQSIAKTYYEYVDESEKTLCKSMIQNGGIHAIDACGTLMREDSEKKLSNRMLSVRKALKEIQDAEITDAFYQEQASWERYKKDRCDYVSLGRDKDSNVYLSKFDSCIAVENYRRIETLVGEPNFP